MSTLDLTPSLGLEAIGKQALAILRDDLNTAINNEQSRWQTLDALFGYRPTTMEPVVTDNFYHGHRPSLIEAPADKYPNCSVMAYSVQPLPEGDLLDHQNAYDVALYVELMCKADDEGTVNSRISRMTDAAHAVLMNEPTLRGLVVEIGNQPSVILTDVFARPERDGKKFVWQGARLEYRISKYANRD